METMLAFVSLVLSGKIFATLKVVKTADGPVLRVEYSFGKYVDTPLSVGLQGVFIGTTLFDVTIPHDGMSMRIKRVSGPVRMFSVDMVW